MPNEVSLSELNQIISRWDNYGVGAEMQQLVPGLTYKLSEKFFDILSIAGPIDEQTSFTLGQEIAAVMSPSYLLCYYIGYELASGRMIPAEGGRYLKASIEPILSLCFKLLSSLLKKGVIDENRFEILATETGEITADIGGTFCSLGISNFSSLNYHK